MTNFERITESPEKMAESLADIGSCRKFQAIGICPVGGCGERHNQCEGGRARLAGGGKRMSDDALTSVNPYLEHHHVCWDRSWAYSNGWIPGMLALIGAWDYGSKRPVPRRVITA